MGFVRLQFLPPYFPIGLLPLYWLFFLFFYVFYLPVYLVLWLFSPYRSRKSRSKVFEAKTSDVKRDLSSRPLKEDSKDA